MPVTSQCKLLGLSRSSVYYRPRGVSEGDLLLMRRIDELHLEHPFLGARKLARLLKDEGCAVGRRHVGALMRRIDELQLEHPVLGARKLARLLQDEGYAVGRRHVGALMRRMGIEPIYRKPRTSLPNRAHRIYCRRRLNSDQGCRLKYDQAL